MLRKRSVVSWFTCNLAMGIYCGVETQVGKKVFA